MNPPKPILLVIVMNVLLLACHSPQAVAQNQPFEDLVALSQLIANLNGWYDEEINIVSGVEVINLTNQYNRANTILSEEYGAGGGREREQKGSEREE
jgi:hypothetical protein